MHYLAIAFAFVAGAHSIDEGLPAAPVDVSVGSQTVELRKPLVARGAGARLVLFVRAAEGSATAHGDTLDRFRTAVPTGSVSAVLKAGDGRELELEHTGYAFYQGYKGLLLTGKSPHAGDTPKLYSRLELDSKIALHGVRVVWLDRAALEVRDLHPKL